MAFVIKMPLTTNFHRRHLSGVCASRMLITETFVNRTFRSSIIQQKIICAALVPSTNIFLSRVFCDRKELQSIVLLHTTVSAVCREENLRLTPGEFCSGRLLVLPIVRDAKVVRRTEKATKKHPVNDVLARFGLLHCHRVRLIHCQPSSSSLS